MWEICRDRQACSYAWRGGWEELGHWEDMGERRRWVEKVKDPGGEYVVDLAEAFLARLDVNEFLLTASEERVWWRKGAILFPGFFCCSSLSCGRREWGCLIALGSTDI